MSRKNARMLEHRKVKETSTEYAFSPETDNFLPGASSDCWVCFRRDTHRRDIAAGVPMPFWRGCWELQGLICCFLGNHLTHSQTPFDLHYNFSFNQLLHRVRIYTKNKRRSQGCFTGKVWELPTWSLSFLKVSVCREQDAHDTARKCWVFCAWHTQWLPRHGVLSSDDEMGLLGPHRWKSCHTQQETQCSHLGMTETVALCVPVCSQPVRIDLLVAVHLGT